MKSRLSSCFITISSQNHTRWGPQSIAFSCRTFQWLYGRYNYSFHRAYFMLYKPTFTSLGGPILYPSPKKRTQNRHIAAPTDGQDRSAPASALPLPSRPAAAPTWRPPAPTPRPRNGEPFGGNAGNFCGLNQAKILDLTMDFTKNH